jgi:hypothetical protein
MYAAMSTNRKNVLLIVVIFMSGLALGTVVRAEDCDEARKWYLEGLALNDDSEREASYYRQAIKLCPELFEAHNKLGEVYKNWGQYELAIKEFQQASRSTSFVEPRNNLGEIYRMQGRYDLAAEEFTQVIKMKPDFREAQNQLKYVQKRLGQYDDAIEAPPGLIPTSIFARIPGMTLPKGSFLVDLQYKFWNQEGDLNTEAPVTLGTAKRDVDVHVLIWGVRYGLTNNLTIGLIPKFFWRTSNVSIPLVGIDAEPSVSGIGDTVFLTKYRLWGRRRAHLSAFHLLSIPTGDEEAEGEDEGIVRRIPLGSGSYSFSPGLALTAVMEPLTIHANIWYVITTDSQARQAGDEFRCDFALVLPEFHGLISMVELNYRWQDSAKRPALFTTNFFRPPTIGPIGSISGGPETNETTLTEEGGHTLFLSPGVQVFLTKYLKAELGFQFPVIRARDGFVEESVVHLGLVKYFF